jgi:hypothetical protein
MGGIAAGLMLAPLFCKPGVLLFARPVENGEHAPNTTRVTACRRFPRRRWSSCCSSAWAGGFISVQDNTDSRVQGAVPGMGRVGTHHRIVGAA